MARVLLVEDDRDVRPIMEYLINSEGHEVTSVARVTTALALLEEQHFDLVITDTTLPDGSGLAVAGKADDVGVKALIVSGWGPEGSDGVAGYEIVHKPFRPPDFIQAIRSSLFR